MYDELVKSLRYEASYAYLGSDGERLSKMMRDAADAIGELQKKVIEWQEEACEWNNKYYAEYESMPRWISVKERLPKSRQSCLCYNVGGAFGQLSWVDIQTYYYDEDFNISAWHKPTMHMELVGEVAYWMPLPSAEGLNDA